MKKLTSIPFSDSERQLDRESRLAVRQQAQAESGTMPFDLVDKHGNYTRPSRWRDERAKLERQQARLIWLIKVAALLLAVFVLVKVFGG